MTSLETVLEKILVKLDKIIENQEKSLPKSSQKLLLETKSPYFQTKVIGKEHDLPTPYSDHFVVATTEDVLPEYRTYTERPDVAFTDPNSINIDTSITTNKPSTYKGEL